MRVNDLVFGDYIFWRVTDKRDVTRPDVVGQIEDVLEPTRPRRAMETLTIYKFS